MAKYTPCPIYSHTLFPCIGVVQLLNMLHVCVGVVLHYVYTNAFRLCPIVFIRCLSFTSDEGVSCCGDKKFLNGERDLCTEPSKGTVTPLTRVVKVVRERIRRKSQRSVR